MTAVAPPQQPAELRRRLHGIRERDLLPLIGGLASSVGLSSILYYFLLPWSGLLGFVVVTYVLFLVIYALLVSFEGSSSLVKDRIAAAVATSIGLLMLLALVVVVFYAFQRGSAALRHLNFWTSDLSMSGPLDPLTQGGVLHAVLGTLIMISIALLFTVPLGVVCAVFLSETRGGFTRFVRTIVEAMTALPSVIAGLAVYAVIVSSLDIIGRYDLGLPPWLVPQKSGLAAATAISIMMLPIIIRAADVVLRLVPGNLKEAAAALGAPRWRVVWHVVLPTARSGLMTAVILGTARGIGETSPVLLTAGYTTGYNLNPLAGNMVSLPLATFSLTKSPEPTQIARGFGAAAVLMLLVLVLFVTARLVGGRGPGEMTKAQLRRRAVASRDDVKRFEARAAQVAALPATGPGGQRFDEAAVT